MPPVVSVEISTEEAVPPFPAACWGSSGGWALAVNTELKTLARSGAERQLAESRRSFAKSATFSPGSSDLSRAPRCGVVCRGHSQFMGISLCHEQEGRDSSSPCHVGGHTSSPLEAVRPSGYTFTGEGCRRKPPRDLVSQRLRP